MFEIALRIEENHKLLTKPQILHLSETFAVSFEAGLAGGFPAWSGFKSLPGDAAVSVGLVLESFEPKY